MCAALARIPLNEVQNGWMCRMENYQNYNKI